MSLGGPLPDAVPRWLLDVDDDLAFRAAVRDWVGARAVASATSMQSEEASAEAQTELARFLGDRAHPHRAAIAATLLGVLAFDTRPAGTGAPSGSDAAESAFRRGVELDPGAAEAAYDLELLLRREQTKGQRNGRAPDPGGKGHSRRGAGAAPPGTGY